ncbi:MAG: MarR family winged helix-turn-helix transcriptional regulator [Acidobacteriota bacterium]
MNPSRLHQLTERLTSLFRAGLRQAATEHGLKLVQLEALIYLGSANRYSDTPAALTEYLGITKGTVSQTLKALEKRGLIKKVADLVDGRVVHCRPTETGQTMIDQVYPIQLFAELPDTTFEQPARELESLLRTLQQANDLRSFGICRSCRFFEPRELGGRCGLTKEALSPEDATKLCREHELAS